MKFVRFGNHAVFLDKITMVRKTAQLGRICIHLVGGEHIEITGTSVEDVLKKCEEAKESTS